MDFYLFCVLLKRIGVAVVVWKGFMQGPASYLVGLLTLWCCMFKLLREDQSVFDLWVVKSARPV